MRYHPFGVVLVGSDFHRPSDVFDGLGTWEKDSEQSRRPLQAVGEFPLPFPDGKPT